MIDYLNGTLAELEPAEVVVECGGVGYSVGISLNTYTALQQSSQVGSRVKVFVEERISEDAHLLFGFATKAERSLFRLLTSVSGVGAATARVILSTLSPSELTNIITQGDEATLKRVKGIGLKTAGRIIIDLRDKLSSDGELNAQLAAAGGARERAVAASSGIAKEAVAALTALGFSPAPSHKVVSAIVEEQPTATVEQVIKLALKRL